MTLLEDHLRDAADAAQMMDMEPISELLLEAAGEIERLRGELARALCDGRTRIGRSGFAHGPSYGP